MNVRVTHKEGRNRVSVICRNCGKTIGSRYWNFCAYCGTHVDAYPTDAQQAEMKRYANKIRTERK